MIVSSQNVKNFLLDVINKANIPGQYVEFVSAVKVEISNAEIENNEIASGQASSGVITSKQ